MQQCWGLHSCCVKSSWQRLDCRTCTWIPALVASLSSSRSTKRITLPLLHHAGCPHVLGNRSDTHQEGKKQVALAAVPPGCVLLSANKEHPALCGCFFFYRNGVFFLSHGGRKDGGRIVRAIFFSKRLENKFADKVCMGWFESHTKKKQVFTSAVFLSSVVLVVNTWSRNPQPN